MLRILTVVFVAGCSAAVPTRAVPASPAARPDAFERWVFRQLRIGPGTIASRTTFELVIDGGRASLLETDEVEHRALSMLEADHGARWSTVARRNYRGTATNSPGSLELVLASDGVQSLELTCVPRSIDAAAPGALRVPSPDRSTDDRDGGRGAWNPPATTAVRTMVCGAGISDPDADDDDALMFARFPGLEYVSVTDRGARIAGVRIVQ
jgi:hypothetical protein